MFLENYLFSYLSWNNTFRGSEKYNAPLRVFQIAVMGCGIGTFAGGDLPVGMTLAIRTFFKAKYNILWIINISE